MQETIEFNERILDPLSWQEKLRYKQKSEMAELQTLRDDIRVRMIFKDS